MTARDRGQAMPLVVAVVALGFLGVVVTGRLAAVWVEGARAATAADAAALACVAHGPSAAAATARANGARLVAARLDGEGCTVTVARGDARAHARAAWRPEG